MMSSTEVAKPHRESAHPTVITKCFGKGQGLSDLALIAQATRSIMTFDHACIDLLISQQLQDMLEFGFAMHYPDFNPIHASSFVHFLNWSIGQALTPTKHWQTALARSRVSPTEDLQQGGFITGKGIGKDRWQVVLAESLFGILDQGQRVIVGPFAHPTRTPPTYSPQLPPDDPIDCQPLEAHARHNVFAFFHIGPVLVEFHCSWGKVVDLLIMETLGMTA